MSPFDRLHWALSKVARRSIPAKNIPLYRNHRAGSQHLTLMCEGGFIMTNNNTILISQNEQQIRERAYEMYLARGGQDGDEVSDWLAARARA